MQRVCGHAEEIVCRLVDMGYGVENGTEAWQEAIEAALHQERERCATLALRHHLDPGDATSDAFCSCGKDIARAIRAQP